MLGKWDTYVTNRETVALRGATYLFDEAGEPLYSYRHLLLGTHYLRLATYHSPLRRAVPQLPPLTRVLLATQPLLPTPHHSPSTTLPLTTVYLLLQASRSTATAYYLALTPSYLPLTTIHPPPCLSLQYTYTYSFRRAALQLPPSWRTHLLGDDAAPPHLPRAVHR